MSARQLLLIKNCQIPGEGAVPTLAAEVRLCFEREPAAQFDTYKTTDGDHGRIEVRRHCVC